MMDLIYLLEDDDSIRKLVIYALNSQGYEAKGFERPAEFWKAMGQAQPDLVLLDIMLPEEDGLTILQKLRAAAGTKKLPVIMLTAKNTEYDRVVGLDSGADDFISKPFDLRVLMAKINALLRRAYAFSAGAGFLEHRGALLDTSDSSLIYNNQKISLTKNEYRILLCLMENKGRVVSREKLMERLWETDSFVDENTLTVNVNRLRKKLDAVGLTEFITTKFGVGYIML